MMRTETGNRSRYLTAVTKLGVSPLEWEDDHTLRHQAHLLSAELNE